MEKVWKWTFQSPEGVQLPRGTSLPDLEIKQTGGLREDGPVLTQIGSSRVNNVLLDAEVLVTLSEGFFSCQHT